jgi:hypothetical protein
VNVGFRAYETSVVERRRDRGLRDDDRGKGEEHCDELEAASERGIGRDSYLGSRPFPWNGAIGWSSEARGTVSGWKGKEIDWRVERTGSRL